MILAGQRPGQPGGGPTLDGSRPTAQNQRPDGGSFPLRRARVDCHHIRNSLQFFHDRGNLQILAGYYDHNPAQIGYWLTQAGDRAQGAMCTTWRGNYDDLEAFARAAWGSDTK